MQPQSDMKPSNLMKSEVLSADELAELDAFLIGNTPLASGLQGRAHYAPENGVIRAATDVYNGNPKYRNVVTVETEGRDVTPT